MRRHSAMLVGMVALIAMPLSANALTADELRSQITTLLTEITRLQTQMTQLNLSTPSSTATSTGQPVDTAPSPALPACPALTRTLSRGATGSDVRSLQSFLLALHYLSTDSVTGYFGALTESAVRRWQADHYIVSSGDAASTGWGLVGARTRAAMLSSCDASIPQTDTVSVGALGLSLTVRATLNVKSSCKAQNYTLDYGDGGAPQMISVPADTCLPVQQTFTHAYASAGSYTVTLTSAAYRIRAPVTLTATSLCSAPVFATDNVPGAAVGSPWTLPLVVSLEGDNGITVTADGAPSGITIGKQISVNASTSATASSWMLGGTPTTTGTYPLKLTARNSCGTTTRTIVLRVSQGPVSPVQCGTPRLPVCSAGTLDWQGTDANGCSLGYACVQAGIQ